MDYNFVNKFIWGNENAYLPSVPNQDALNIMGDVLPKDLMKKRGKKKADNAIIGAKGKKSLDVVKENAEEISQESELDENQEEQQKEVETEKQVKQNPFESEQENNISDDYEDYEVTAKPPPPVVEKKKFLPNEQDSEQDEEQLDEDKNDDDDEDSVSIRSKESIMNEDSSNTSNNASDTLSENEKWQFYQELYKFDMSKGIGQFLKVLNLDQSKEKIYKLTDLFYPYDKNEYDKLMTEVNLMMQPRINEAYQQALELKRERLIEFLEEIKTTKKEKEQKAEEKQKEAIKTEQQSLKQPTLTIEFQKREPNLYSNYSKMLEQQAQQPPSYAKVSSAAFIKSLYDDMLKNYEVEQTVILEEKKEISEEKVEKIEEAQVSFRRMSFSLNEENKKQFIQPFKKIDTPQDTPNFDLNEYFEGLDQNETPQKPQLKTPVLYQSVNTAVQEQADNEKQVEKQKEELDFLEQIQKKIKLNNGYDYWKTCEVNECTLVKNQPIYKFSYGEPVIDSKEDYFGKFENELLHKFFYFNEELFDIEALFKAPKEKYQDLVIDLNDNSLFYEKIHGQKYRRNNYLKRQQLLLLQQQQQQTQQNQRNEAMEEEIPQTKEKVQGEQQEEVVLENLAPSIQRKKVPQFSEKKSMTALSKTESKQSKLYPSGVNQMNEQEKMALKKCRIQLVKQGMDPRAISQNLQQLRKQQLQSQQIEVPIGKEGNNLLNYLNSLKNMANISKLQHSPLAESFKFNNFFLLREHAQDFHRFNFHKKILKQAFKRWWQVQQSLQLHSQCILGQTVKITIQKQETRTTGRQNELVDSGQRFKTLKHLSAKEGDVTLIEFIEENPLIIQNPGMSSKIIKYIQSAPLIADPKAKDADSINRILQERLGSIGSIVVDKRLPLLAQLGKDKIGCMVMENNLYKVPLWKQKRNSRDFLLVKSWDEERECFRYFVRRVNGIYIAGPIEPSLEVYSPNSRFLTNFIKKCLNFQIKHKFKENGQVSLNYLKKLFPSINDHGLRKAIKDLGGEQDLKDQKVFKYNQELIDSDKENENQLDEVEMSAEEVCLYEKKN